MADMEHIILLSSGISRVTILILMTAILWLSVRKKKNEVGSVFSPIANSPKTLLNITVILLSLSLVDLAVLLKHNLVLTH